MCTIMPIIIILPKGIISSRSIIIAIFSANSKSNSIYASNYKVAACNFSLMYMTLCIAMDNQPIQVELAAVKP